MKATAREVNPNDLPVFISMGLDEDGKSFIYNPGNGKVTGPYTLFKPGFFNQYNRHFPDDDFYVSLPLLLYPLLNNPVGSPFWFEEANGYTLCSRDGTSGKSGFEDADVIDMHSIQAEKDGFLQVYDENLDLEYAGLFEGGGTMLSGIAPVKRGESWVLTSIDEPAGQADNTPDRQEDADR